MTTPVIQTWVLNNDHSIATWVEHLSDLPYAAECKCGWHYASANGGVRNWNVDGHAKDVLDCIYCGATGHWSQDCRIAVKGEQ